jgi:surface antigen
MVPALHRTLALAALLGWSASCASVQETVAGAPKTTLVGLGGAAAGGLLGAAIGGSTRDIAAGVALGGLLGAVTGNVLDQRDRRLAAQTAQDAFERAPTGRSTTWTNPDTGNSGSYTPTRTFQTRTGQYCREFQNEVTIGGKREQAFGTACRQPDGSWQIQQS